MPGAAPLPIAENLAPLWSNAKAWSTPLISAGASQRFGFGTWRPRRGPRPATDTEQDQLFWGALPRGERPISLVSVAQTQHARPPVECWGD